MSNQPNPTNLTTGQVRLSYVHVFKPFSNQPGQEPKYSVTILLPKSDIATKQRIDAAIHAAVQAGVSSKWNGVRPPQIKTPIWDGDGLRQNGEPFSQECKGHWVFTASSKQQPSIVDINLNPIINQTEIYSGIYARVNINFFPFFTSGNKGIGCGLGPIQKVSDGEPLGNQMTAEAAFGNSPGGYAQQAPVQQYQQPAYQVPTYPQQPYQQPVYPPQAPVQTYQQPVYAPPVQQPVQQPQHQPTSVQFDPITGRPITGGIMGI